MDPNTTTVTPDPYYANQDEGGIFSNKKRLLFILIGALFIVGVISLIAWFILGRGGTNSSDEEATLVYWGLWEDASVLQPVFDEFQTKHPNIKIQYEKIDIKTLGDYIDRLKTRTAEGNGPDIMRFHSSWLMQLDGILTPLPADVVESTGLENDYYAVVQRDLKKDGAYYGLPLSIDTLALYINNDLLNNIGAEPPTSWYGPGSIDSLSRDLTVIESGNIVQSGVAMGAYDNIAHASDIIALLLLQNGADFKNLNSENAISALIFYTPFADSNTGTAVWDQRMDNSKIAFAGGKLAMYFGYSWDIFEIKAFNPNLEFQVVPAPTLPGTNSTVASYWAEGVSSKTEHPEAAFEFIKFLGQNETIQKIYENQVKSRGYGSPYPKKSLGELVRDNNQVYPFLARAENAISTFFSSDTYDSGLNEEMNIYLGNAIKSMINDNTSAQSAVETLSAGVNQVLSRYEGQTQN